MDNFIIMKIGFSIFIIGTFLGFLLVFMGAPKPVIKTCIIAQCTGGVIAILAMLWGIGS